MATAPTTEQLVSEEMLQQAGLDSSTDPSLPKDTKITGTQLQEKSNELLLSIKRSQESLGIASKSSSDLLFLTLLRISLCISGVSLKILNTLPPILLIL